MASDGIGASVKRKEDYRFITGGGSYTDDIDRPGQVYAYFVRSPHAHARINGIDKRRGRGGARRARGADRRRRRGRQVGRADLRLDGQIQGRLGHEGRAAPDPGPGQGALRRRPRRLRGRRNLSSGQGRGRAGRGRLRGPAGLRRDRACPRPGPAAGPRRHRRATRSTSGSSAIRRRSIRRSPAPPTSPRSS